MRRLTATIALVLLLIAVTPGAQGAARGTIRGVVVNQSSGEPQAGVEVTLTSALEDGSGSFTRRDTSDTSGRYRFVDLPTGDERFYALDAHHEGGLFAGRAITLPSDTSEAPEVESSLKVWDTTTDPRALVIRRDDLFTTVDDRGLQVIESLRVVNIADEAYIGRAGLGERSRDATPTIGFAVPARTIDGSVAIVDSDLEIPQLLPAEYGFAATIAIPPDEHQITYTYRVDGDGGSFDISRVALYPILEMTVHAADPLRIESNRLQERGPVEVGDRTYDRWGTDETIDAGDELQALALAEAGGAELNAVLLVGLAAIAALAALGFALMRRRPRSRAPATIGTAETDARSDVVAGIAELDLRYRAGEITQQAWAEQRAALKRELEETTT